MKSKICPDKINQRNHIFLNSKKKAKERKQGDFVNKIQALMGHVHC